MAIQRRACAPPTRYRIFPNMNCEIFVNCGEHFTNARCGDPLRRLPLASVFGPRTGAYDHATSARSDWFLLQLTPLGVRDLLGCPLAALVGADHDLAAVAPSAAALAEQIAAAPDFAARLRLVEDWAMARLDPASTGSRPGILSQAHAAMLARPALSVGAIAARLDIGARQLRSIVRDEFGMSPKSLLGHARFEHAWSTLFRTGSINQASALFADQAHLTRAFQRYGQLTPNQYRRLKASGDPIRNGVDRSIADRLGIALD
ncbi:helix-turn-helix domain-containing protein [Novosphingobium sp.]|uniref:helix-turn-helix transcriptional regulator n=1 Tax=Novosphingobium sp. TaxID=1874826 RepID=UPI002628E914|nr:helix-turn-helix domain-containing protein [Novosphingobium sp.]